jgi:hypothetical protein
MTECVPGVINPAVEARTREYVLKAINKCAGLSRRVLNSPLYQANLQRELLVSLAALDMWDSIAELMESEKTPLELAPWFQAELSRLIPAQLVSGDKVFPELLRLCEAAGHMPVD